MLVKYLGRASEIPGNPGTPGTPGSPFIPFSPGRPGSPWREEPQVIPSSQQLQRARSRWLGTARHTGGCGGLSVSGNMRLHPQLPWESSRDILPGHWGIAEEKILLLATRQSLSYHILAFIMLNCMFHPDIFHFYWL